MPVRAARQQVDEEVDAQVGADGGDGGDGSAEQEHAPVDRRARFQQVAGDQHAGGEQGGNRQQEGKARGGFAVEAEQQHGGDGNAGAPLLHRGIAYCAGVAIGSSA